MGVARRTAGSPQRSFLKGRVAAQAKTKVPKAANAYQIGFVNRTTTNRNRSRFNASAMRKRREPARRPARLNPLIEFERRLRSERGTRRRSNPRRVRATDRTGAISKSPRPATVFSNRLVRLNSQLRVAAVAFSKGEMRTIPILDARLSSFLAARLM